MRNVVFFFSRCQWQYERPSVDFQAVISVHLQQPTEKPRDVYDLGNWRADQIHFQLKNRRKISKNMSVLPVSAH